jgi:hypothetical protein
MSLRSHSHQNDKVVIEFEQRESQKELDLLRSESKRCFKPVYRLNTPNEANLSRFAPYIKDTKSSPDFGPIYRDTNLTV